MADREFRSRYSKLGEIAQPKDIVHEAVVSRWKARLADRTSLTEADGLTMLADFGLAAPSMATVTSLAELNAAINNLAFPIVLKTAEDYAHKSDVDGVRLNLTSADEAIVAYTEMAACLGPKALVMEMVPAGFELSFGAVYDVDFGSVVIVSAGGVLIEFLNDKVAALAPFDCEAAQNLLSELRIARLLAGYRSKPAADMDGLARQLAQFSKMVALLGDTITEIDINPVICGPDGSVAVDCLVLTKAGVK
jgi:hypothetical protein